MLQRRGVTLLVLGHDQGAVPAEPIGSVPMRLPPVITFSKGLVVAPQPYFLPLSMYGIGSGCPSRVPLLADLSQCHVKMVRRLRREKQNLIVQ